MNDFTQALNSLQSEQRNIAQKEKVSLQKVRAQSNQDPFALNAPPSTAHEDPFARSETIHSVKQTIFLLTHLIAKR